MVSITKNHLATLIATICLLISLTTCFPSTVSTNTLADRADGGCGLRHDDDMGITKTFSIQSNGRKRPFNVHLPKRYDATKPTAMIIAYHGRGQGAEKLERITMLSKETVNPNMIMVYPEAINVSQLISRVKSHSLTFA